MHSGYLRVELAVTVAPSPSSGNTLSRRRENVPAEIGTDFLHLTYPNKRKRRKKAGVSRKKEGGKGKEGEEERGGVGAGTAPVSGAYFRHRRWAPFAGQPTSIFAALAASAPASDARRPRCC